MFVLHFENKKAFIFLEQWWRFNGMRSFKKTKLLVRADRIQSRLVGKGSESCNTVREGKGKDIKCLNTMAMNMIKRNLIK